MVRKIHVRNATASGSNSPAGQIFEGNRAAGLEGFRVVRPKRQTDERKNLLILIGCTVFEEFSMLFLYVVTEVIVVTGLKKINRFCRYAIRSSVTSEWLTFGSETGRISSTVFCHIFTCWR